MKAVINTSVLIALGTRDRDVANWINELAGNKAGMVFKAKKLLGYEPKTDMKTGLKKTYEWIVKKIEACVRF